MRNRTSLAVMAVALLWAPAALAANKATLSQTGANQALSVDQTPGNDGTAVVIQSGGSNVIEIYQDDVEGLAPRASPSNLVDIQQAGTHNLINTVSFDGAPLGQRNTLLGSITNTMLVKQAGDSNKIAYSQIGYDNYGAINQGFGVSRTASDHNIVSLSQEKAGNSAHIDQAGSSNFVGARQLSDHNNLVVDQQGAQNDLIVNQHQDDNAVIDQSGLSNSIHLLQLGNFDDATIEQGGDSNDISLTQVDSHNTAAIYQTGSLNDLKILQQSKSAIATVVQTGQSGMISLKQ